MRRTFLDLAHMGDAPCPRGPLCYPQRATGRGIAARPHEWRMGMTDNATRRTVRGWAGVLLAGALAAALLALGGGAAGA